MHPQKTGRSLRGAISVPGDKSIAHRALMLGGIAEGDSVIHGMPLSGDVLTTRDCMRTLGVQISDPDADGRVVVEGRGTEGLKTPLAPLDCRNSGTTARLLCGLLSAQRFGTRMVGDASLTRRPMRRVIDLPSLFRTDGGGDDPVIHHGDAVYVERAPLVYIYGEVQRPGALRLERGMTLLQALAAGGGLTQRGTDKGIRVHRRDAQGQVQVLTPGMDDRIQDGDVVYVRESLF